MINNKLLFFSYDFPPVEGGISRLCDEIVKQFIHKGWDVEAISEEREIEKGYRDDLYPIQRVPSKRFFKEFESYKILKRYPKDTLIITGVWHPEALISILAGHKNVVVLAHGNDIMQGKKTFKNFILSLLRKYVLSKAKLVICNSHYTQNTILEQFPCVNSTVCTLGVDEERFSPAEDKKSVREALNLPIDKKIILTTSRIDKYKAHDTVLKALALLDEKTLDALCYCIVGRGNYLEELKKLASQLNVDQYIHWYGFIEEDDLPKVYQASDLFVLCTREEKDQKRVEGFGLVFLEAQSSGVPAIGSNQGGIPDAIKHQNGGWLVERDDHHQLAHYFKQLAVEPQAFKEEGMKARQRVLNEATWGHFSEKVFKAIEENV
ncbi:glycosyltransferase family 4 protein [Sulfurovum sp. XTW-4]|uniref:Glycosyltransferase family 4 protein n=1 Tax=Sulfurovum xiamenensis TaxID=3019066 RepID=A0ABT7QNT9_9BACT|nr:glycosyltransferase family 4 protein [Sulfurovum xiamenensis]MDM5262631.1 glycosyltransferase family 4 protein [Sulfurovum xiamenensis]